MGKEVQNEETKLSGLDHPHMAMPKGTDAFTSL